MNRLDESLAYSGPQSSQEDEWVDTALENNYGVKAARAQLKAARRAKELQSSHLPTVDATVTQVESVTEAEISELTLLKQFACGYNFPPSLTGGLTKSRLCRQTRLQNRPANCSEPTVNVTRDTRNLYKSVTTDVVRVQARLAIRSSQSALEATETGYEVGTRNIVDVLQAQQRLFGSQFDYAILDTPISNLMRLKQSAGTLSEADPKNSILI